MNRRRGRMRNRENPRGRLFGAICAVARTATAAGLSLALVLPANAQFWGGWGAPQPPSQPSRPQPTRAPQQYQQQYNPFQGVFGGSQQQHQQQPERERERQREPERQRGGGEIQLDFS